MNKLMWVVIVGMLVFFLVFLSISTIGKLMPYEPLVVNTYEFPVEDACPGDLIDLTTDRYVQPDVHIDNVHVESYWTLGDDPRPYIPYSYDITTEQLRNTEGTALRLTPFTGGEWQITTEFQIEGTVLGFVQREQNLELTTDNSLTVPEDTSDCRLNLTTDRTQ